MKTLIFHGLFGSLRLCFLFKHTLTAWLCPSLWVLYVKSEHAGASLWHTCAAQPSRHRSIRTGGMQPIQMFDICTWFSFTQRTMSYKASNTHCGELILSQVVFNLHCNEGSRDKGEDRTPWHVINLCLWLKLGVRGISACILSQIMCDCLFTKVLLDLAGLWSFWDLWSQGFFLTFLFSSVVLTFFLGRLAEGQSNTG